MKQDRTSYQLEAGLCLDARGAIWFAEERVLAVADLHLGYAWAHRHAGQLLPIAVDESASARLTELAETYRPREIVLLGDIVHEALPLPALKAELCHFFEILKALATPRLVGGNHDRKLPRLLQECGIPLELTASHRVGNHLLIHGDQGVEKTCTNSRQRADPLPPGRIVMGHEHPAITLGDGAVSSMKCSCFLVSERVIVLPAFSRWAGGAQTSGRFMSKLAQEANFDLAVAIVAGKLLPVELKSMRPARRPAARECAS